MNATCDIRQGDALEVLRTLPRASVQCIVTSPPYFGLRDYGVAGQLGLEPTHEEYVAKLVDVFHEAREGLKDDGILWLNIGDSYAGSWGAQSRGGPPSASSTLQGNGHVGGGPKLKSLSAVQIAQHPKTTRTGSLDRTPGLKPKDLMGIPWRLAFALQADGWWLRSDCIWHKPNPMPESITDRPTKAHEYVFLLTKSARYFYDADAVAEPCVNAGAVVSLGEKSFSKGQAAGAGIAASGNGLSETYTVKDTRNIRTVWPIASQPFKGAHFATFPQKLAERCVLSGSRPGDTVLDPFAGAGTTGLVALRHGRAFLGIELNPAYVEMAKQRIATAS